MVTKDEVMRTLALETADFSTLEGIAELQKRVEAAHGLLTEHRIITTTDRLTGENADDPVELLAEIDAILDDKQAILKNAACDLSPIAWGDIPEIQREWLIPNWLPANTVTMFTGQGGAGKSWLTLQVACEIASNAASSTWSKPTAKIPAPPSEYDDTTDNEPKHIVFATYEDEPAEIKRRLNALASTFDWIADQHDTIKEHLHIVDMRGIGSVWGPGAGNHIAITGELLRSGEALRSVCENIEAQLLILDPLSGAFGGNENDRTAVYDFVSSFRGWGDAAKVAMLIIGHLPKTEGVQFSGSTAWEASARAMWLLGTKDEKPKVKGEPPPRKYFALQHSKSNYAKAQGDILLGKNTAGWWEHCRTVGEACEAYTKYGLHHDPQENESHEETDLPDF